MNKNFLDADIENRLKQLNKIEGRDVINVCNKKDLKEFFIEEEKIAKIKQNFKEGKNLIKDFLLIDMEFKVIIIKFPELKGKMILNYL